MTNLLTNGLTGQGDQLLTATPLYMSGQVWFVNSATGVDAGGARGQSENQPLATLSQAINNSSNYDLVVLMDGHTETLASALLLSKTLTVIGAGSSGGRPTAKINFDANESSELTINTADSQIRNVWFGASLNVSNTNPRVLVTQSGVRMIGCYFDCDQYDDGPALRLNTGANNFECLNTTFVSTATSIANRPDSAIYIAAAIANCKLDGVVIDGGAYGFAQLYALDGTSAATTMMMIENMSLLRGADIKLHASTTGYVNPATVTGSSKTVW